MVIRFIKKRIYSLISPLNEVCKRNPFRITNIINLSNTPKQSIIFPLERKLRIP
ncbi:MAG: hypothetical protein QXY40_02720 [Candidatus Methanomethylicia archaeon]